LQNSDSILKKHYDSADIKELSFKTFTYEIFIDIGNFNYNLNIFNKTGIVNISN